MQNYFDTLRHEDITKKVIAARVKLSCLRKSLRVNNATQEDVDKQQAIVDELEAQKHQD